MLALCVEREQYYLQQPEHTGKLGGTTMRSQFQPDVPDITEYPYPEQADFESDFLPRPMKLRSRLWQQFCNFLLKYI